jgi:hypothetical protein
MMLHEHEAGNIPSPTGQAGNEAGAGRVGGDDHEYDRDRPRLPLEAEVAGIPFATITLGCRSTNSFANIRIRSALPAPHRRSIRRLRPSITLLREPLCKPGEHGLCLGIVFAVGPNPEDLISAQEAGLWGEAVIPTAC